MMTLRIVICIAVCFFFSCKPQGPLTPRDAFVGLKDAIAKGDAAAFTRLLSQGSVKKIKTASALFAEMDDRQIKAVARKYDISADTLKKLCVEDFAKLYFKIGAHKNAMSEALNREVAGIYRTGNTATVRVDNGMELSFTREGPYWKFELGDL